MEALRAALWAALETSERLEARNRELARQLQVAEQNIHDYRRRLRRFEELARPDKTEPCCDDEPCNEQAEVPMCNTTGQFQGCPEELRRR